MSDELSRQTKLTDEYHKLRNVIAEYLVTVYPEGEPFPTNDEDDPCISIPVGDDFLDVYVRPVDHA